MTFSLDELRSLEILEGLPDEPLDWLSKHGTKLTLAGGDRMFSRGEPSHYMFIVVSGSIQRYEEIAGQWLLVSTTNRGQVTGMLPFSRMTHYPGHTVASVASEVLRVNKDDFIELLTVSHELGQRLVAEMSNRVRRDVRLEQQREKMMALGRLSAGLSHELNNPASAISRTSDKLAACLGMLSELNAKFARLGLEDKTINAMNHLWQIATRGELVKFKSLLERSDYEEELASWLEKSNISIAWKLSAALTDTGVSTRDLEDFTKSVPSELLEDAFTWVAESIAIDRMVGENKESAERISQLIESVKSYSDMDRSPEHRLTDVREGLNSTIIMFERRLKEKSIRLKREYEEDLPQIPGNSGELNQLWTNIIDNALDAMEQNGELILKTESDEWGVIVRIIDDGCGILPEIAEHVFDPFVTTKGVGEGTGLGLNIARTIVGIHGGQIEILNRAKGTEVRIRLPHQSELIIN